MRRALPLLVGLWLACAPPPPPTAGGACAGEGGLACDAAAPQLLECRGEAWAVYADCHGPAGCSVAAGEVSCDLSGNTVGDRCPPSSEGKLRCDPDGGARILRCSDGGFEAVYDCPDYTRCALGDGGLTCW